MRANHLLSRPPDYRPTAHERRGVGNVAALRLVVLVLLMSVQGVSAERVLYQQDFEGAANGTDPGKIGLTVNATAEQSEWTVVNGCLQGLLHHKPDQGGSISVGVPKVKRGRLEFRAWIGEKNTSWLSLTVSLYGMKSGFDSRPSQQLTWLRFAENLIGGEKGGWALVKSPIPADQWHNYRIDFDGENNVVLYYVDDMDNPVRMDTKVPILPVKDPEGGYALSFGNHGLCTGDVTVRLDDIRLVETTRRKDAVKAARRNIIVVDGFDYQDYKVHEALKAYQGGKVLPFNMTLSVGLLPKIKAQVGRVITDSHLRNARLFIMTNAPAPALKLPTRQWLKENVEDGLGLVILGGLFSFGKGQYEGTQFEELSPVRIKSKWSVKRMAPPLPIVPVTGVTFSKKLNWKQAPSVLYYHDVELKKDAKVWLKAGDKPILVVRKLGEGWTAALLTAPLGKPPEGTLAFWQWEQWPTLLNEVMGKLADKRSAPQPKQDKEPK